MLVSLFTGFLLFSFIIVMVLLRPKKSEKAMEKRLKVLSLAARADGELEDDELALPQKKTGGLTTKLGDYLQQFDFSDDLELLILHANSKTTVGVVVGASIVSAI